MELEYASMNEIGQVHMFRRALGINCLSQLITPRLIPSMAWTRASVIVPLASAPFDVDREVGDAGPE